MSIEIMLIIADVKLPHAATAFGSFGEVRILPTKQITREAIADADAILIRSETRADKSLLDGMQVRFVGTATIGTDHVDLEYLKKNDIAFASCPGSNANSVAEYVLAALLEISFRLGLSLKGKTIGIVGHGNTGGRVAKKAEAIGMRVVLNDPPLQRVTGDPCYLPLDALMEADFLSLHVPLTKGGTDPTHHLFDERRLSAMKRGSILINSSRGAVVETEALKTMLRRQHVKACILDVWEREPYIDSGMLEMAALATPHIAGYSYDGKLNATRMLQKALGEFMRQSVSGSQMDKADDVHELALPEQSLSVEEQLRYAVRMCYDIGEDEKRLRQLLSLSPDVRADYFQELRANYPMRREFHNYRINASNLTKETADMLSAVGFKLQ